MSSTLSSTGSDNLTAAQRAIVPIAAFAAVGNSSSLHTALQQGLDSGLSISEVKELLVQVYAYAGFPRSLNALGELMKVVRERKERGVQDAVGHEPTQAPPEGQSLLEAGTRNQTKLAGTKVAGPLFEFAPAIDRFLKTHLFGDIFERDNLDWKQRELATISMLSALEGVGSQLQSHLAISMNVGLSANQLQEFVSVLTERVDPASASRAAEALENLLANKTA